MTAPARPVPSAQQRAFELAVADRLGIDPETAVLEGWRVEDGFGTVTLHHVIDPDELLEMFNTGQTQRRSLLSAVRAAAEAMCACDGAGCEETFARRLLLSLLAEQDENKAGA